MATRPASEVRSGDQLSESGRPNRVHGTVSNGDEITVRTDRGDRTVDRHESVQLW